MADITYNISAANVITVPIDDTLTIEGQAADAKAVGDALDLKADRSEIQDEVTVNGQEADAGGNILVTAEHVKLNTSSITTVAEQLNTINSKTAAGIMVAAGSADTVANVLTRLQNEKAPASAAMPSGGTAGQVLQKQSSTAYHVAWADGVIIDDTAAAATKVYSSNKVTALLGAKASQADLTALTATVAGKATTTKYTATFSAASWGSAAPYSQTVAVTGILATDTAFPYDVDLSELETTAAIEAAITAFGCTSKLTTADGSVTMLCLSSAPQMDFTVAMRVVR